MALSSKERAFAAIFAGLAAGFVSILLLEMLSPFHPPANIDPENPAQVAEWMQNLPKTAYLFVWLAYALGALTGGFVTNKVAAATPYRPALITGVGLAVTGFLNQLAIPHPLWFTIGSALICLFGAWWGGRLARRRS